MNKNFTLVLSEEKLQILSEVEDYKKLAYADIGNKIKEAENEAHIIIENAKKERDKIIQMGEIKIQQKMQELSEKLKNSNSEQIKKLFDAISRDIMLLLNKTCMKFFVEDSKLIKQFIMENIEAYLEKVPITIKANRLALEHLRNDVLVDEQQDIVFEVDDSLDGESFIVSDCNTSIILSYDEMKKEVIKTLLAAS